MHPSPTETTNNGESEPRPEWDIMSPLPGVIGSYRIGAEDHEDAQTANRLDQDTMLVIQVIVVVMLVLAIAA